MFAPPFVEDTDMKGRGLLMGFAAGAVGSQSGVRMAKGKSCSSKTKRACKAKVR